MPLSLLDTSVETLLGKLNLRLSLLDTSVETLLGKLNLRLSLLDTSVETLLGKLNRANESFSESMGKVGSLSLNLRHFLDFNSEKAQTQQTLLSGIEKCIKDILQKAEVIEESLKKNEDHVASLHSTINEFKNFKPKDYPNFDIPMNVNKESSNSFFSVDHQNRRVIESLPPSHLILLST